MNKLRTFVVAGSVALALAVPLTALEYGIEPASRDGYLTALVAVVLLPSVPVALAYGKLGVRRVAEYRRNGSGLSFERKSIFVSEGPVGDVDRVLADVETAVESAGEYDECRRDQFGEGPGFTIRHTGFHNSFVRVTGDGRLVVTGASENTHSLASLVERVTSLRLKRTRNHPFAAVKPVRGAPRAFLGVLLVAVLLVGAGGLGAAAYPADAYGAPERAVLVGYDARSAAVPGYDGTDATLDKAAFLVSGLDEEAVELSWDRNGTSRLSRHSRQSVFLSARAADMLATAREGDLTAAERDRVSAIEADLHAAECRVASSIATRIEEGRVEGDTTTLEEDRATLRGRAADAGVECDA